MDQEFGQHVYKPGIDSFSSKKVTLIHCFIPTLLTLSTVSDPKVKKSFAGISNHHLIAGIYLLLPNDRHVQHKNNLSNWGVSSKGLHI